MADTPAPEVSPAPDSAPPEVKAEAPKAPKLDSTQPLTRQVDKILEALPPKEEADKEAKAEDKKGDQEGANADKPADSKEQSDTSGTKPTDDEPEDTADAGDSVADAFEELVEVDNLPPMAKYIWDNLPEFTVMGHTEGGKDKAFRVKRIEDLPWDKGFDFASKRDELLAAAAHNNNELNARELKTKWEGEQQQNQVREFLNQQAVEVESDITALQAEGLLPEFKYDVKDPKFNSDPAVKTANEIYELFEKTNQAYAQAKKSYRISYRDAADKYFAMQARSQRRQESKDARPENQANQAERAKVAAKVSAPQGAEPGKTRPRLPQGSKLSDVMRLYNQGRI